MGIGGLGAEFNTIFRRAFASRVFPPSVVAKLGIQHVKGILLYGPPGTGKTLMARQIGMMLNGKEPKKVNGPSILDKFVGGSEKNIRDLFADAEAEYKAKGENSDLHIIIFDEIDAICKQRGSVKDSTGVADTVVNQLLSMIDGVDALNNILVIGMTNRKDLIDEALLRPGRFEVHIEINLPDEAGRREIFLIHTKNMRENQLMGPDVNLNELAALTKNYSGAEIAGLTRAATSYAFNRQVDPNTGQRLKNAGPLLVTRADFMAALAESKPAFGVDDEDFQKYIRNGIIEYGPKVARLLSTAQSIVEQVRNSQHTPLVSVLLEGPPGAGCTALAVQIARTCGYPFVKVISPAQMVGYSEGSKCSRINQLMEDAYKSPLSCVVIDDIERLLDFVRIGPRFSNNVLQTLLVLLKKEPPKNRKLLLIGTTSQRRVLEDLEFMDAFNRVLHVPQVETPQEFVAVLRELVLFPTEIDLQKAALSFHQPMSIRRVIFIAEMSRQGPSDSLLERFVSAMEEMQM